MIEGPDLSVLPYIYMGGPARDVKLKLSLPGLVLLLLGPILLSYSLI